jgi:serine/threonine-protein kinase
MHGSSVVLIALITSALTALGVTYLMQRYQVFPVATVEAQQVLAPMLVGLSEADARDNAQALQLALLVEGREVSAGAKAGTVLRQSIAPGHPVPNNVGIGVVIAAPLPTVPRVTELSLADAKVALAERGYKSAEGDPAPSAQTPVGSVMAQSPAPDTELAPGGVVTLHVSSGPAEVEAPKLMGMPLKAAEEQLAKLGLTAKVRWISKAETVTGTVLSQKPAAGEKLAPKATVEVVVNR